jgi:hypothetical protein
MVEKVALTLGALALAFGGAALVAPAAHADSSAQVRGAKATFTSDGDVFRLYDTACDGSPAYLEYRLGSGSVKRRTFTAGCNKSIAWHIDFAEGALVNYRACVDLSLGIDRCSPWKADRA